MFETLRRAALSLVAVGTFLTTGCSPNSIVGEWKYQEGQRIKSPDSEAEAVLLTADAGATTAASTLVFILPAGGKIDTNKIQLSDAVFEADHLKGFHVAWKKPQVLSIQYNEARISRYRNLWIIMENRKYSYPVEIRLDPTSSDSSLSAEDKKPFLLN